MCILHIVFCTVCKYVLSICKLLLFFLHCLSICKLLLFFLHCLSICKLFVVFLHCLSIGKLFVVFLHCLSIGKLFVVFLHCLSIGKLFVVFFLHCLSIGKLSVVVFFCTVWSTLIRISLTKALVLWWCDNKSDLIWFDNNEVICVLTAGSFPWQETTSHLPLPATSGLHQVQRKQISLYQWLQKHRLYTVNVWERDEWRWGYLKRNSTRRLITSAIAPFWSCSFVTLMHFALHKCCYPAAPEMLTYIIHRGTRSTSESLVYLGIHYTW